MSARKLFLVETGGPTVMGHAPFATAVGSAVTDADPVRFAYLPPLEGTARRAAKDVPIARRFDADLQQTRWHLVQSARVRRRLRAELAVWPADVVTVLSHAVGLLSDRTSLGVPVALSADAPMWAWRSMGIWRPMRRHSRALLGGSLALERRALRRADGVHAWSRWTRDEIVRAHPGVDVFTQHPGLDVELYRPAPREPRERPRVLFVGGRFAAKGGEDLLAAVEPLLGTDLELDVVTTHPLPERPGLRRHELSGGDPRLIALYQQADVLCLPTHGDAVPWVVLEALACGTPVIGTPVAAIPELLGDGRAGVVVPRGRPDALRDVLTGLLGDDARRRELGEAGRALCEEQYDARQAGGRLLDWLDGLARRPVSGGGAPAGAGGRRG